MRIAVSGAHGTGKTTLIEELVGLCPGFNRFDEPYYLLEEEGHAFAEMPCLEDFELQLERSIRTLEESEGDCLFDRCPSDILAYLITHEDSEGFDLHGWLPRIRDAMQRLDLIVFVPIEKLDRVPMAEPDHGGLRLRVHEELAGIVLHDQFMFGVPVIEVTGTREERARYVLECVTDGSGTR
jgi:hypothetical protein